MIDERDPVIQSLFDGSQQAARDDTFVADVMTGVNALRRRSLLASGTVAVILVAVAAILAGPIGAAVNLLTSVMPQSLIELDAGNALLVHFLAPLNSVAAVVGVGLLLLGLAFRKIFCRR